MYLPCVVNVCLWDFIIAQSTDGQPWNAEMWYKATQNRVDKYDMGKV